MPYYHYFFIATYLLIATISQGMQSPQQFDVHSIQHITTVKNPRCVEYIANDCVAISSARECCILDLETKALIRINRNDNNWDYINYPQVRSNHKKVISSLGERVAIYDIETGVRRNVMTKKGEALAVALHPRDDTILFSYGGFQGILTTYNYVNKTQKNIIVPESNCLLMDIHPTKEIMCAVNLLGDIFLHPVDNVAITLRSIILPIQKPYRFLRYNLDGSCIVMGDDERLCIIDPDKESEKNSFLKHLKNERFKAIAFHPHGLLATLVTRRISKTDKVAAIHYWDVQTKQLLHTMSELGSGNSYDLSFSPDGLEVIVALEETCVRSCVPFALKEKCTKLWWWLHQIKDKNNLPEDIVIYCMSTLLKHLQG